MIVKIITVKPQPIYILYVFLSLYIYTFDVIILTSEIGFVDYVQFCKLSDQLKKDKIIMLV